MKLSFKRINPYFVLGCIYALWLLNLLMRSEGLLDDFDVFFHSGKRLLNGENIYGEPHYINLRYFYSPLFSCIMALFQGVDVLVMKVVWWVVNVVLLLRLIYLVYTHIIANATHGLLIYFLTILLMSKIVLLNVVGNQMTIVMLWTAMEAYHQLKKDRIFLAVFVLCLGINIKLLPMVVVPYILYIAREPKKVFLYGIGIFFSLAFLPAFFIGWDYNLFLISEWWKTLNPVSSIHAVQTYEEKILDAGAMISKYLSDKPVYNEPSLNIAAWSDSTIFLLTNAIRVAMLSMVLYFAYTIKKPLLGLHQHIIVLPAFLALVPICFPHQREYSFLFHMPLIAVQMSLIDKDKNVKAGLIFAFFALLSGMLTWVDFAGEKLVAVFMYYRLITMGFLLLLVYYIVYVLRLNIRIKKTLNTQESGLPL